MLAVRGLGKTFETPDGALVALRRVEFEVADGEFFALLGPSGCGKTTTLRCVAGLERPDTGEITIGGVRVTAPACGVHVPAYAREIGMVFQSYAIWPHLDVFDNVAYPLQVRRPRLPRAEIAARVMETLALVGMEQVARRSATALSGGQQQRVALARALVRRSRLLLLDEPLSNLDARLREQMQHELADLVRRVATTTLYVTHDQNEALALADRIAVMDAGRIVQVGSPGDLYRRPETRFVATFLGRASLVRATLVAVDAAGAGRLVLDGDGGRLRLPVPEGCAGGERLDVVIRSENLACSTRPPAQTANVLAGAVERFGFPEADRECHVRVAGATLRARLHPPAAAAVGDRVWLTIDPVRCSVFRAN